MNKTFGNPGANSDVVNREPKTLLIGYGWVGQFVHKYFTQADIYTKSKGLCDKDGDPLVLENRQWDIAFIAVPSPMNDDGSCDVSIVEESVKLFAPHVDLFVVRSTVTPGTCDRLAQKYNTHVVMQPEYLGETLGHPLNQPQRDPFIILGGPVEDTGKAAEAWARVLNANCRIRQVSTLTAELCKYMENCFLGVKVLFVNEFRALAETIGVDFLQLREAWLDDPRIGRSHSMAYKENPGFSGKCLPKDLNSIAHYARTKAISPLRLIESALQINADMRKDFTNSVPLLPKNVKE